MKYFGCYILFGAALWAQPLPKEAPARSLSGTAVFGWLDSTASETFKEHTRNPFTSLRLDFNSYLLAPDFLTYRVQPRYSAGFQDAFTGVTEGTGVAFETVFLPRRPWPFRFHYSRFERKSLTSGLSSSYARFISQNQDSNLGFQWQYLVPHQPSFEVSFDKISTAISPESVITQGFDTRSRTVSLTGRDRRWGWDVNGGVNMLRLNTNYLLGSDRDSVLVASAGDIRNMNLMASRELPGNLHFYFSANSTNNQSSFDRGRFDQAFDSISGKLEYRTQGKFQAWTQARLTDSALDTRALAPAGEPPPLLSSVRISNRMLDSEARYQVHPSVSVFARNEVTHVTSPGADLFRQTGNFVSSGAGAQFLRTLKGVALSGSYVLNTTLTHFNTAEPGHSTGHSADGSISTGDPGRILRVTGSFSLNRSQEIVRALLPYTTGSESVRLIVARTFFHRWTVEVQGALNRLRYTRQEFTSAFKGHEYGISVTGPRYFASYNRTVGAGNSFQQLLGLTTTGPADFTRPLLLLTGTTNASTTATASWNITHSAGLRGIWRDQAQTIGPQLASRFQQREATFSWQFRKVRVEAGYLVYRYYFGSPVLRKNIVFRLIRDFQVF